jgi:N-acetylmuramoyl-L-alanine amidase
MKIKDDHRLYFDDDTPYPFVESPNFNKTVQHEYLIWHYTANNNADVAIRVLTELKTPVFNGVSAHLVIGLDGTITQLVPFDKGAWHAGESHWEGKRFLNLNSIGIEIVNDGKLKKLRNTPDWVASSSKIYAADEILIAKHPNEFFDAGWPFYPQAQLDAVLEVSQLLVSHYGLKDALAHEDIADVRIGKVDTGPAFPKDDFRERIFQRRQPIINLYELTETVQVLEDRGRTPLLKLPAPHPASPLKPKTQLTVSKVTGGWAQVKIKGGKDGWVDADQLDLSKPRKGITLAAAPVYAFLPDPKPPIHPIKTLPQGLRVRILREEDQYVLVANMQGVPKFKVVHGWIPQGKLRAIPPEA